MRDFDGYYKSLNFFYYPTEPYHCHAVLRSGSSISLLLPSLFLPLSALPYLHCSFSTSLSHPFVMASPGESGSRICTSDEAIKNQAEPPSLQEQHDDSDRKARIEEVWKKMNSGMPLKDLKSLVNKPNSTGSIKTKTTTPSWMFRLGIAPAKAPAATSTLGKRPESSFNGSMEEAKKLAAAALLAAKDAGLSTIAGRGKVEITEVRDFAGEEIEFKKLVGADSKEASEKARASSTPPTALDTVLEQIKKKTKLSVLDKTKKDWNEFKDENKGLEEELDAYKKSSNQYLDKVSFLERTDLREFERERDARLTLQARRRTDMREDDL